MFKSEFLLWLYFFTTTKLCSTNPLLLIKLSTETIPNNRQKHHHAERVNNRLCRAALYSVVTPWRLVNTRLFTAGYQPVSVSRFTDSFYGATISSHFIKHRFLSSGRIYRFPITRSFFRGVSNPYEKKKKKKNKKKIKRRKEKKPLKGRHRRNPIDSQRE